MSERWIQGAIGKPGSLRRYVKNHYGIRGFVKRNGRRNIKVKVLRRLSKKPGKIGQKARLALTLRKLRR